MSQPSRIYTIKLVFVKKPRFIADILMLAFTEPPFPASEGEKNVMPWLLWGGNVFYKYGHNGHLLLESDCQTC